MVIDQGEVVWVEFPPPRGSAPAGRRPALVLQHDRFNRSRIQTVVVVAITSNLKYAAMPGNVRLKAGEAGLPRPSVINITQISSVDRAWIVGKLGKLSSSRVLEVWEGILTLLGPAALERESR